MFRNHFRNRHGLRIALLALLAVALSFGPQAFALQLSVQPPSPTSADIVSIRIVGDGGLGAGVVSLQINASKQIFIGLSGACFGVPTVVNLTAVVGRLAAGTYTVIIDDRVGCLSAEPLTFQVSEAGKGESAIPALSSTGLVVIGAVIAVMAGLALRKRGA